MINLCKEMVMTSKENTQADVRVERLNNFCLSSLTFKRWALKGVLWQSGPVGAGQLKVHSETIY